MRAGGRLFTAIAIIFVCGFAVDRGWIIVQYSWSTRQTEVVEKQPEALETWMTAPVVAGSALQIALKHANTEDPIGRRGKLQTLLAIKPLSSPDWLALSQQQLVTDSPMDEVTASLLLSMVTGPNEGYVKAERAILSLAIWDRLSPDLKRRTANDLSASEVIDNPRVRAVLATKSQPIRSDVRSALAETGLSSKEIERRLGF
jgi:hypothetical protein